MVYVVCPYTQQCVNVKEIEYIDGADYTRPVRSKNPVSICISNTAFNRFSSGYVPTDYSKKPFSFDRDNYFFHTREDHLTLDQTINTKPVKMTEVLARQVLESIMQLSGETKFNRFLLDIEIDLTEIVSVRFKKGKPKEIKNDVSQETISQYCKDIEGRKKKIKNRIKNYFEYKKDKIDGRLRTGF